MSFMNLYSYRTEVYVVETTCGTEVIPSDVCKFSDVSQYVEGKVLDVETRTGWIARYSANGYMDCTPWCGPYDTEEEAVSYCRDLFGDDFEEEEATA